MRTDRREELTCSGSRSSTGSMSGERWTLLVVAGQGDGTTVRQMPSSGWSSNRPERLATTGPGCCVPFLQVGHQPTAAGSGRDEADEQDYERGVFNARAAWTAES
jgi:hypothetical protein